MPSSDTPIRRRWLPRSLSARLVAGVVVLVIAVVVAVSVGTYLSLHSFLYDRLDQQLQSTASASSIKDVFSGQSDNAAPGVQAPQKVYAIALGPGGVVVAPPVTRAVETLNLSESDREQLADTATATPLTVTTTDGVALRVTVRTGTLDLVPARFVIGLSTSEVEKTLDRLLKLELGIGLLALVVAAAATHYGVRFGLRHLYRVTQTAQEVAAELSPAGTGLDRRVEVDDPGTEVGTLAESMNTLLSAVETQFAARLESEQRMRQFLADASHELRTPLTSIRGYAELARMQRALADGGESAAETGDNLARIESEGTRMSRLVDDLLTLARTDGGALPERVSVDVAEMVDDVVSGVRAAFPDRVIEVSAPSGLMVVGDHDQLLRVLRNLVTNAATYTRPDGPIAVRAFAEAHAEGAGVTIQVLDSGPGLPPEESAHVFERFWRADKARTSSSGGSGLGLSIVASIVAAHGGKVHFDSAVATGSTVTVWLPSQSPADESPGADRGESLHVSADTV